LARYFLAGETGGESERRSKDSNKQGRIGKRQGDTDPY
jgi:hypothetical protein